MPASFDPLPRSKWAGKKYVEYMGGAMPFWNVRE